MFQRSGLLPCSGANHNLFKLTLDIVCGPGLGNDSNISGEVFLGISKLVFHQSYCSEDQNLRLNPVLLLMLSGFLWGELACIQFKYSSTWVAPHYSYKLLRDLKVKFHGVYDICSH